MLYDINELADYIAEIMKFYYPSMFKNLNDLCFPVQVNNLKACYYFINFILLILIYFTVGKKIIQGIWNVCNKFQYHFWISYRP